MGLKKLVGLGTILMFVMSVLAVESGVAAAAKATAKATKDLKILKKVSKEGRSAMMDVRWARVAIFEGQPEQGEKLLENAKTNLMVVEKQAPELAVAKKGIKFIPIDAGMMLSEDFVATPEKQAKIKEANEHLRKGESAKAIEVLHQADIDVTGSLVLMPVKSTIKHVDQAISLMKDHKYYEANLALKGAEDGLILDTVMLYEPIKPAKKKPAKKK
jgi:hypothetical protein